MTWEDVVTIQQLVCSEREARDRCWWEEMRRTYRPDAEISLSWYQGDASGFVDGSIKMARGGSASSHKLGPVVVRVNEHRAIATVSATIEARTTIEGVESELVSDTRLLYRVVKGRDGEWLLASLDCIYEKDKIVAAVPGSQLQVDAADLHSYRPTYRNLSYVLERKGFPVNGGLLGDDRPDGVEAFYNAAFEWLVQDQGVNGSG